MSTKEFVKIAVGLREHPKVLRAGDDAGWFFVCSIMWSKEHDTDGFIPDYSVPRITGLRKPHEAVDALVTAGLFEPVDGGWRVHDYLDHQESAERRRAAAKKAAAARWGHSDVDAEDMRYACESHANRTASASANRNAEEEEEREEENNPVAGGDVEAVFEAWKESTGKARAKLDAKRRRLIAKRLKEYPVDELCDAVRGWRHSPHHRGENDRHTVFNELTLLLRDGEQVEKFRDLERDGGQAGVSTTRSLMTAYGEQAS